MTVLDLESPTAPAENRLPRLARPGRWTAAQLVTLVRDVANGPAHWAQFVRFDPDERFAMLLERGPGHDLWLLTWLPGQHTGLHDHGGSTGAFAVVSGRLREHRPSAESARSTTRIRPGRPRVVPDPIVHDVGNVDRAPAISIHAYSPPLSAMTYFDDALGVRTQRIVDAEVGQAR